MVEELEEKVSGFKFQVREKKMAKVQKFEELKIWQDAREVAKRVYELTRSGEFAKDFGLKDQIQRAAVNSPKSKDDIIKVKILKPET